MILAFSARDRLYFCGHILVVLKFVEFGKFRDFARRYQSCLCENVDINGELETFWWLFLIVFAVFTTSIGPCPEVSGDRPEVSGGRPELRSVTAGQ